MERSIRDAGRGLGWLVGWKVERLGQLAGGRYGEGRVIWVHVECVEVIWARCLSACAFGTLELYLARASWAQKPAVRSLAYRQSCLADLVVGNGKQQAASDIGSGQGDQ